MIVKKFQHFPIVTSPALGISSDPGQVEAPGFPLVEVLYINPLVPHIQEISFEGPTFFRRNNNIHLIDSKVAVPMPA